MLFLGGVDPQFIPEASWMNCLKIVELHLVNAENYSTITIIWYSSWVTLYWTTFS